MRVVGWLASFAALTIASATVASPGKLDPKTDIGAIGHGPAPGGETGAYAEACFSGMRNRALFVRSRALVEPVAFDAGFALTLDNSPCIARSKTFPKMIAIGEFSKGVCSSLGALHGCEWNDPAAARVEMAAAGWTKAGTKKREALALAWLREVEQWRVEDEHVTDDRNTLVIEYWQTEPSGEPPALPTRYHYRVAFAADGTHDVIKLLL